MEIKKTSTDVVSGESTCLVDILPSFVDILPSFHTPQASGHLKPIPAMVGDGGDFD